MYGPMKPKGKRQYYPTLHLDLDYIPEAKKWEVGKTYKIEIEVKMVGKSESKFQKSAEFDIVGIEADGEGYDSDDEKAEDQENEDEE